MVPQFIVRSPNILKCRMERIHPQEQFLYSVSQYIFPVFVTLMTSDIEGEYVKVILQVYSIHSMF